MKKIKEITNLDRTFFLCLETYRFGPPLSTPLSVWHVSIILTFSGSGGSIVGNAFIPISSLLSLGMYCLERPGNVKNIRSKCSAKKCREQMTDWREGIHSARCLRTNSIHFFFLSIASGRSSFQNGILWSDKPFSLSATLEQPYTTQRSGILYIRNGTRPGNHYYRIAWNDVTMQKSRLTIKMVKRKKIVITGTIVSPTGIILNQRNDISTISMS